MNGLGMFISVPALLVTADPAGAARVERPLAQVEGVTLAEALEVIGQQNETALDDLQAAVRMLQRQLSENKLAATPLVRE